MWQADYNAEQLLVQRDQVAAQIHTSLHNRLAEFNIQLKDTAVVSATPSCDVSRRYN